jgi:WD40 repeat protein
VAGNDRLVRIWNLTTGKVIYTLRGHTEPVRNVAFSPDGRFLGSADGWTCRIWDGGRSDSSSQKDNQQ